MMAASLIPRCSDEVVGGKNNSELFGLGTVPLPGESTNILPPKLFLSTGGLF